MRKYNRPVRSAIVFLALLLCVSCGGGGGGGAAGIIIAVHIVNESGATLPGGQYSVLGSGVVGNITNLGTFSASSSSAKGELVLVNNSSGFRYRRVPFDTSGAASLDLGNVTLLNDALSKGWGEYRTGSYSAAESQFRAHIDAAGRSLADARDGLGWTLARTGEVDKAFSYLLDAVNGGYEADVRTALAMVHLTKTARGEYSIPQVISNLDLAINDDGFYLSKPLHDNISEDDLIAMRAMMNILDGRMANAAADRNSVKGKSNAVLNSASDDLLIVVDFFLGQ